MSENKNIQGILNKNRGFSTPNTINSIREIESRVNNTSKTVSENDTSNTESKADFMSSNTENVGENQTASVSDVEKKSEKLEGNTTITLAFRKEHKKILQEHFESEGIINYSTGIRSVLLRYMKAKKLI